MLYCPKALLRIITERHPELTYVQILRALKKIPYDDYAVVKNMPDDEQYGLLCQKIN